MEPQSIVDLEAVFNDFLESFGHSSNPGTPVYELKIGRLASEGKKSIIIDFKDIYMYDMALAESIIDDPDAALEKYSYSAFAKLRIRDPEYALQLGRLPLRIRGLPRETPLRLMSEEQIGKLVMISGIIVRSTPVRPFVLGAMFECEKCGIHISLEQKGQTLTTPYKCDTCSNRRGFRFLPKASSFIPHQNITIQEKPEDLPPGETPRQLDVSLKADLVESARPGDRVNITGVIDLKKIIIRGGTSRSFEPILEANNVDLIDFEVELLDITEEDLEKIREIASDPWVFRRMLQSIAPSLYGLDTIKEAVMYLLFGGVSLELPDVRIRGDINVLLVGDPGTGKSQLLGYAARAAPRGLLTDGMGSSAAGLTAAVVKEGGTGRYILEAGALVLADLGVCCIDEMDKMKDEDRQAIHPAMEQQRIRIAKGGIVATMNARTSILAAANPVLGRYNPYQNIAANLGTFPVTILSRFDLIFILRDRPEPEKDARMAEHIIGLHKTGSSPVVDPIGIDMLRKYIMHAKGIDPILTDDAGEAFQVFYVKMRSASVEGGEASAISITARQLESLVRLSQARARVHLRDEVTVEDAEAVIALYTRSLEQVGIDTTTGEIDIDIIYTGKPRSLQMQLQKVLGVIGELERVSGAVQDEDLFTALLEDNGIARSEAARLIGVLMRDGTIYSPRPGYYRRTS